MAYRARLLHLSVMLASALECDTDACVRLVEDRLTENNVMSEPLVDLLDL